MSSRNSKTSDLQKLLFNLSDKTDLKGSDSYVAFRNISIYIHRKIYKRYTKTINLTLLRTGFFGGQ